MNTRTCCMDLWLRWRRSSCGISSNTTPGRVIYLKLPANNANAIKLNTNLAISQGTTVVSFTSSFMTNLFNTLIDLRVVTNGLLASGYTPDTTKPTFSALSFNYVMSPQQHVFTFSEAVYVWLLLCPVPRFEIVLR